METPIWAPNVGKHALMFTLGLSNFNPFYTYAAKNLAVGRECYEVCTQNDTFIGL